MKRLLLLIAASAALSIQAFADGKTAVAVELHNTPPDSPANSIKGSSPTVTTATAAPVLSDADRLAQAIKDLRSPETAIRARAIAALNTLGPKAKAALPALAETLGHERTQREAAQTIHAIDPTYIVPANVLARLVKTAKAPAERDRVRTGWISSCDSQTSALDTLGALGPAAHSTIPDLTRLMLRSCIHGHVVQALSAIGEPDQDQLTMIAGGLQAKDPEARQAAIEYLSQMHGEPTPVIIQALGRAMNDSNSGVRLAALQALDDIHPEWEGRLPSLAGFLKDPSPDIRQRALFMIGRMGPEATTAVPLLHQALRDPEAVISLASAKLLARMDPNDETLIGALINLMKVKGSAPGDQAATILESLNVHDARIDGALEPYRQQAVLNDRISNALSGTTPEEISENARTLKVQSMRVASGIVQDQPVHSGKVFPATVGRLYCWTDVSVSSAPATIVHRWYHNGKLHHEVYLQVLSTSSPLWSSSSVRSGDWKVEVAPAGVSEPLATALFSVSKAH